MQLEPTPEQVAEVVAVCEAHLRSLTERDFDTIKAGLSPRFTIRLVSGYRQDGQAWLHEMRTGRVVHHSFLKTSVYDVRFDAPQDQQACDAEGVEATISSSFISDATIHGKRAAWRVKLSFVFLRSHAEWLLIRTAATPGDHDPHEPESS